jgi:hypothetical protein
MKLILKEDPKEWRKATWLSALGFSLFSSLLRWRGKISTPIWLTVLAILACVALAALLQPRVFRGWYRLSTRIGFGIGQFLGRIILAVVFVLVFTPLGIIIRLLGKDPLRLRRDPKASTYWTPSKETTSLDRPF